MMGDTDYPNPLGFYFNVVRDAEPETSELSVGLTTKCQSSLCNFLHHTGARALI